MTEASPVAGTSGRESAPRVDAHSGSLFLRAVYEGDLDRTLQLIHAGVPVDISNSAGLQALHFAAKAGHVELASALIKHGADLNATTAKGSSPLHVAALLGQTEVVKLLLRHNADVNSQSECNDDSFSPLYMSAQIGHQEIVTLLLAHGADPTIVTKNGSSPRDVATQQGYQVVAEILEEYEKRTTAGAADAAAAPEPAADETVTAKEPERAVGGKTAAPKGAVGRKTISLSPSGRLRTGPPPVYQEAIPSPKQSPLRTRSNRMNRSNNVHKS